jgi:hypothetical protein
MSVTPQENQSNEQIEQKSNDKEYNFAQIRKQLEQEKQEKQHLASQIEELKRAVAQPRNDDDDDDEPYIDRKKLRRESEKVKKEAINEAEQLIERKVSKALEEERRNMWLKGNPDFYDTMQHAQKLYEKDPELAESIIQMPDTFERQKLVYRSIKTLGLHEKAKAAPSIQEKIDANKRSPYYQPASSGTPPYSSGGDFSDAGMKSGFTKMKELQKRMGLS